MKRGREISLQEVNRIAGDVTKRIQQRRLDAAEIGRLKDKVDRAEIACEFCAEARIAAEREYQAAIARWFNLNGEAYKGD